MADPNYFLEKDIVKNNSIIYVFIQDLPIFVNLVFIQLSMNTRVTLVTGMDDFGAPLEIFSPKGRFKVKPPITMRQVGDIRNPLNTTNILIGICISFY